MAKNHRANNQWQQKRQVDYNRSPENPQTPQTGGAGGAFKSSQPGQQGAVGKDNSSRPDPSKRQDEVGNGASPERNATSQGKDRGYAGPSASGKQNGSDTEASPSENTASQDSSPSAIDPSKAQEQTRPLPDLTQGIPSTLEYETTGRTKPIFNLTEVEEGSGRGRGQLPDSAYISSSERNRLRFANYSYAAFFLACAVGTVYLGRNWESEEEEKAHSDAPSGWSVSLWWKRAKARMDTQLNYYNEPAFPKLLPDPDPMFERPYTLVLSLEDLLVHSEWTREHGWRMAKRPGVDYFLRYLCQYYELVIFTTQPWAVAEPIIKKLDPYHIVTWPLFREATLYENGEYVKVCTVSHLEGTCH